MVFKTVDKITTVHKGLTNKSSDPEFGRIASLLLSYYDPSNLIAILAYGSRISSMAMVDSYSDYDVTIVFLVPTDISYSMGKLRVGFLLISRGGD